VWSFPFGQEQDPVKEEKRGGFGQAMGGTLKEKRRRASGGSQKSGGEERKKSAAERIKKKCRQTEGEKKKYKTAACWTDRQRELALLGRCTERKKEPFGMIGRTCVGTMGMVRRRVRKTEEKGKRKR